VLSIEDGLPKMKDLPKETGGSGEVLTEYTRPVRRHLQRACGRDKLVYFGLKWDNKGNGHNIRRWVHLAP
jgi:hypothetical protein